MPGYSLVFSDSFARADGNVGNGWGGNGSFNSHFQISGNKLNTVLDAGYSSANLTCPVAAMGKQKAQVTFTPTGAGSSLLGVRMNGVLNGYSCGIGGGALYLFKHTGGSPSVLNNSAGVAGAVVPYVVTLEADGNSLQAKIATAADPTTILATVNATDSTYATGTAGLYGNCINSTIDDFLVYKWLSPALTPAPDNGFAEAETTIVVTAVDSSAAWLSAAPDLDASDGTINSVTVLTDTTMRVVFTADDSTETITFTENTTGLTFAFDVFAPLVIFTGDSQNTGPNGTVMNTLTADIIAGLTTTVDHLNFAVGGYTVELSISAISSTIEPVVGPERRVIPVFAFVGTNSYYLNNKTGAEVYAFLCDWSDGIRLLGDNLRPIVVTTPNRHWLGDGGSFPADDPTINTRINAGNVLIRADASNKLEYVDFASLLNAVSAEPNTWATDGVHLRQTPGADTVSPAMIAKIQRYLTGSSLNASLIGGGFGKRLIRSTLV
jgi:hypothetical protein